MAVPSNKLLPIAAAVAVVIMGAIYMRSGPEKTVAAPMTQVPLPATLGADQDTPDETLATVVQTNRELRQQIQEVLEINKELRKGSPSNPATARSDVVSLSTSTTQPAASEPASPGIVDTFSNALGTFGSLGGHSRTATGTDGQGDDMAPASGVIGYKVLAPMGYVQETKRSGNDTVTQYVRRTGAAPAQARSQGSATQAAAAAQAQQPKGPEPFFTIPENATLAGVTTMTSLIGRVPVNGRVTDPMQFKALIGRDNLAANGWELPEDLAGMVVTGIAIGDMALSCTEGKIRSMTFVFNDGAIRTVSSRRSGSGGASGATSSNSGDLGFISDLHGNPCVQGTFVTNAPRYLADLVGIKGLGLAAEALAQAQTTVTSSGDATQSAVTGNAGNFALGRMGSAATEELAKWLTERLKSSFDAVVSPSGMQIVVHLDQEIHIDKPASPRKLVHSTQTPNIMSGARYGLQ